MGLQPENSTGRGGLAHAERLRRRSREPSGGDAGECLTGVPASPGFERAERRYLALEPIATSLFGASAVLGVLL
ncbi:MAG TPA: hypothetical protein VIV57_22490 [Anaeromyxobacter sp.]